MSASTLPYRTRTATRRIILHDTRTGENPDASAKMLTQGRSMGLLGVGYHYVVERDARVVRHTPEHCIGAHTPGHNWDSIGVAIAGPEHTPEAIEALAQLCLFLAGNYEPRPVVLGDSEVRRNHRPKCPAFDMDEFRERLNMENTLPEASFSQQHTIILEMLKAGRSVTPKIAIMEWGIGSLTSRIAELRAKGHPIKGEWREDTNGKRYMKYSIGDAR